MDEIRSNTRAIWRRLKRAHRDIPPLWKTFEGFVTDVGYAPSREHSMQRLDVQKPWNAVNAKWIDPSKGKGEYIIGRRYGQLVVRESTTSDGSCMLICECDCGEYTKLRYSIVTRKRTQSCGCLVSTGARERFTTHGGTNSKTFNAWANMNQKCRNVRCRSYSSFGGAGIGICERWEDFGNFLLDMGEKPDGLYLNRRDKDGDFTPENCFWSEHIDSRAMSDAYRLEGLDIAAVKRHQQDQYIADLGNAPDESGFARAIRRNREAVTVSYQ